MQGKKMCMNVQSQVIQENYEYRGPLGKLDGVNQVWENAKSFRSWLTFKLNTSASVLLLLVVSDVKLLCFGFDIEITCTTSY